jgi:acetate---CoA ligase (ADP-forming)
MSTTETTTDVVIRDGSTISVRIAGAPDVGALLHFLQSLSPESLYQRFHGWPVLNEAGIRVLLGLTGTPALTLVAETGGQIVGFASCCQAGTSSRAEIAFAVADAVQGRGVGTRLLEQLANAARETGIDTFDAYVLGDNRRMLEMFHDSGFSEAVSFDHGICHVVLSLAATDRFMESSAARSQSAAAASMRVFFEPRVVAVIGANRTRGRIGSEILNNLIEAGFTGTIVPVHPDAREIAGLEAYPRASDIPGPVDLAIVVVPAAQVLSAVDDCIAKNVRAICVISAGFSECDEDGRAREALLVEKVRRAGCRLIGPNCMGLLNTDPAVRLNATFSPVYPPGGTVAMSTQSGALGLAILDYAKRLDIGFSSFA